MVRVRVVRRGGLAGVPMTAEVDTSELGPPRSAEADEALQAVAWNQEAPAPAGRDRFTFRLSLVGDGEDRTAVVDEENAPDGLRPLLDLARTRAEPDAPRGGRAPS